MAELKLLDPMALDREVLATARELTRARRSFAAGEIDAAPAPFARRRVVSSKASFDELGGLASDPLFAGLRSWVGALTLVRVTFDDEAAIARALHAEEHRADLWKAPVSARGILLELLREPATSPKRELLANELARACRPASDAARHHAERYAEAAKLLGADPGTLPLDRVSAAARKIARAMTDVTKLPASGAYEAIVDATLARDATEGWPSVLGSRWLSDLFGRSPLVAGLRLDLPAMPPAIGGSSFARALAAFGRAVADADLPPGVPFVVARAPLALLSHERAALFGALPADAAFGRAFLGLGRDRAREQARKMARAFAASILVDAIRVLVRPLLVLPAAPAADGFEEIVAGALGASWPSSLLGASPRSRPSDAARFASMLTSAELMVGLRDRYDEDWFKNPRAHEELRHGHHSLPGDAPKTEAIDRAADVLVTSLREAIG